MSLLASLTSTSLLEGNNLSLLAIKLLKNLKPYKWPIKLKDFPLNTSLVGGAVRDGLLDKHNSIPDLDFVVNKNAIDTCKNFARKYGGTAVELDAQSAKNLIKAINAALERGALDPQIKSS